MTPLNKFEDITITIGLSKEFYARKWVAVQLLKLAGWVLGATVVTKEWP